MFLYDIKMIVYIEAKKHMGPPSFVLTSQSCSKFSKLFLSSQACQQINNHTKFDSQNSILILKLVLYFAAVDGAGGATSGQLVPRLH